ncbi:MAG TPA: hypothetical protein VM716_12105, partial [Gemmatimonadales bacterium]|nr:hypothetical protein [Gemmatimonadales bacterium]
MRPANAKKLAGVTSRSQIGFFDRRYFEVPMDSDPKVRTPFQSARPPANTPLEDDGFSRKVLAAMLEYRDGNFAVRLPSDLTELNGKIADTFNAIIALSDRR